jgi:hypothetical protein
MAQQYKVGSHATRIGKNYVQYHGTTVVSWDEESFTLNSGGWRTATTKTRMNQAARQFDLPYRVYQQKGEWYVDSNGKTFGFQDGMVLPR